MSNPNEEGPASLDMFYSTILPAVYQPVQLLSVEVSCLQEQISCTIFMRSWLVALDGKQLAAADQIARENTFRLAGPSDQFKTSYEQYISYLYFILLLLCLDKKHLGLAMSVCLLKKLLCDWSTRFILVIFLVLRLVRIYLGQASVQFYSTGVH